MNGVDPFSNACLIAKLRADARSIFNAGLTAADPFLAVQRCLQVGEHHLKLSLNDHQTGLKRLGRWPQIHLIAFGKAACAMADAAQSIIPTHRLAGKGIAVTNDENVRDIANFDVYAAGHPLPDARGIQAAHRIREKLSTTQRDELVLVLVSGGGSALLPAPISPITLAEKIATTQCLLASGATIQQMNCIRKHLSTFKGGGLAKLAAPAAVHGLILSDVIDDDLSSIASGPTVADPTRFSDAITMLKTKQLWEQIPSSVQDVLTQGLSHNVPETPKPGDKLFEHVGHTLVGSNTQSLHALLQAAKIQGYQAVLYRERLSGEARVEAAKLAEHIQQLLATGIIEATAIIAGGESTVTLTGSGQGGRNQEFALAFALAAEQLQLPVCWVLLSGGTDGRDGPTDAAGGLIDGTSISRLRAQGIDPQALLENNDSYHALKHTQDLLITGATGTNVADLQVVLIHPSQIKPHP